MVLVGSRSTVKRLTTLLLWLQLPPTHLKASTELDDWGSDFNGKEKGVDCRQSNLLRELKLDPCTNVDFLSGFIKFLVRKI